VQSHAAQGHHRVYKALFRPLLLCGVERRLFFLALLLGAATFNLFYSFLAGLLVFALIYGLARISVGIDQQMLSIALRSIGSRPRYDAARWSAAQNSRAPRFQMSRGLHPMLRAGAGPRNPGLERWSSQTGTSQSHRPPSTKAPSTSTSTEH
jgi:type IV secretory pathway VirB3-like protein